MTKRQTFWFFLGGTLICAIVFLALTAHTHTRFPELTNTENLTPEVKKGMKVWGKYNCVNCHTLLGEGAYYAPDLTKITKQRGEAYLAAFLRDPSQYYSDDDYGRVMPTLDMTDEEITQVIAFLDWVSEIDTNGWPPRPILVTGSAVPGANLGGKARGGDAASKVPVERGEALFNDAQLACFTCHSVSEGVNLVGPSLAGLPAKAAGLVETEGYAGDATSAEGYIRESILDPNAHLVEGPNYSSGDMSLMPANYDERLDDDQVDALVEYMMSLR